MDQVSVRDSRKARDDRRWIESVYRDYLNDLAPAATGIFPALGEIGHRVPDQLVRWYADPNAQVMIILYGQERAGFAMVDQRLRQSAGVGMAAAVKFWRRVVAVYTGSKYQEEIVNGEVHQHFESGSRRTR